MKTSNSVAFLTIEEIKAVICPFILETALNHTESYIQRHESFLDTAFLSGLRHQMDDFDSLCTYFEELPQGACTFFHQHPEIKFVLIFQKDQFEGLNYRISREASEKYAKDHNLEPVVEDDNTPKTKVLTSNVEVPYIRGFHSVEESLEHARVMRLTFKDDIKVSYPYCTHNSSGIFYCLVYVDDRLYIEQFKDLMRKMDFTEDFLDSMTWF